MRHQAVILKKLPLREDDELVMCYTREFGKQRYQAKSSALSSSKQGGHLDVLNHVEFNLIPSRHATGGSASPHGGIIASAAAITTFPQIKRSLPALGAAFVLLECFDQLVFENQEDPKLWRFLLDELYRLEGGVVEVPGIQQRFSSVMGHGTSARVQELAQRRFASLAFFDRIQGYGRLQSRAAQS